MSNNCEIPDWNIIENNSVKKSDIDKILNFINNLDEKIDKLDGKIDKLNGKIDKLSQEKNLGILVKIEEIEKELKELKNKIEPNSSIRAVNNVWRSQYGSVVPSILSLPNLSTNYLNQNN